ncbi:AAA family ATPase [Xenophilus sp. Marseille-Q4582]|uniref:AAA family ATPase n=1 Tax=Xenophilus sp. Marseille-Q4582 TaxID=2866600 RepID=UPI001CE49BC0|nr:AAA family ATPase [Xenophilus sp. Marseille-Q4582]
MTPTSQYAVTATQAAEMMAAYIRARIVPMIHGSPGIGKSQIAEQLASEYNLKLIDLRLAQYDPTEINGFANLNGSRAEYLPMAHFPLEADPIPDGYSGWLLFLDELTSAAPAVQAAAYKLILDRAAGMKPLHQKCAIVAAGNLATDNAIVHDMSTALQSRMAHLELRCDVDSWLTWAMKKGIDYRITSYIRHLPQRLYTFKPDHSDKTYACPRTWEMADRLLKIMEEKNPLLRSTLGGVVTDGIASEFMSFLEVHTRLPTFDAILRAPLTTEVPQEPSVLYALSGAIAARMDKSNFDNAMKFVLRMPPEFQVVTLKEARGRNSEITKLPSFLEFLDTLSVYF